MLRPVACLCLLLSVLWTAGCSIAEITRPDSYRVQRGDTLYSIAWRHKVDWREVARWNNIPPPYRIYPGQVISLERYPDIDAPTRAQTISRGGDTRSGQSAPPPARTPQPAPAQGSGATARRDTPRVVRLPTEPTPEKPAVTAAAGPSTAPASAPAPQPAAAPRAEFDVRAWRWPTRGKLLRTYAQNTVRQGIDISGAAGQRVIASNAGQVVYSGSGLRGYGNLVIIKHDDEYLSAYGFNRSVLVREGQTVAAGQPIAEMGLGPRNEAMLHFEIRRDGRPIDPVTVLPR